MIICFKKFQSSKTLTRKVLQLSSQSKIPSIDSIKKEWDDYSSQYDKFDLGPQTFFYSLAAIMQLKSAKSILQVACGTGKLLPLAINLKGTDTQYRATDISPKMISIATANLKIFLQQYQCQLSFEEWCKANRLTLQVHNSEEPFKQPLLFDRIICNCALMITQDATRMLTNLHRHAAAGCLFGVSVWGNKTENNFMSAIREAILENGFDLPPQRSNFHLYKKVGALAESTGWQVVLNWEQNALFPVLSFDPVQYYYLLNHQVNKLPEQQQEKVRATLYHKLENYFANKMGLNFSCQLYVLRKK